MTEGPIITMALLSNFLALITLCIISVYYYGRQARALEGMRQVEEEQYFFNVKRRREAKEKENLVSDPRAWISQHLSFLAGETLAIRETNRIVKQPLAVDLQTDNGYRVVISPTSPSDLRRLTKPQRGNGALVQLHLFKEVPLLGRTPGKVKAFERSIANAGEYFDLEAAQVGQALGAEWGTVDRLWFYLVPAH
jgi:hypothetical protein